jgi:hypothetical protein
MVRNLRIYSKAWGNQQVHLKGRGFGSVLLGTKIGDASSLVNGASPPEMEGFGVMSKTHNMIKPSVKKIRNIVF